MDTFQAVMNIYNIQYFVGKLLCILLIVVSYFYCVDVSAQLDYTAAICSCLFFASALQCKAFLINYNFYNFLSNEFMVVLCRPCFQFPYHLQIFCFLCVCVYNLLAYNKRKMFVINSIHERMKHEETI
jgi:hypothetical protein